MLGVANSEEHGVAHVGPNMWSNAMAERIVGNENVACTGHELVRFANVDCRHAFEQGLGSVFFEILLMKMM